MTPIIFPAGFESIKSSATLMPSNAGRMRQLARVPMPQTIIQVVPEIIQPTQQHRAEKVEMFWMAGPGGRQGTRIAETSFVGLGGRVIMRMHDDGFGNIHDSIALRSCPARVFIVFGVLQFFQETATSPDVLANAAADHAEKMIPICRLPFLAKATFVIPGVNPPAIS